MNLDFGYEKRSVAEAEARVRTLAPAQGWIIAQSFTAIEFKVWTDFPLPFASIFSGRIFGASGEVRWLSEGAATQIWNLQEKPGNNYLPKERRYYLWGYWEKGRFAEAVVRDLGGYPVTTKQPNNDDRPFISAREYLCNEPSATLPPKELMFQLNRPRVAAHRFVNFDCGRDQNG